jgi:hypothetical protein
LANRYESEVAGAREPIAYLCSTCGTQYAPSVEPPNACLICLDERQYVPVGGQRWTTLAEIAAGHKARVEPQEPGLLGLGLEPAFAIGQRALLVEGLLWDCIPLIGDELEAGVGDAGGLETIAISHPHYYTTMVDWADRFDARILLHEADRDWVMRPSPRIELWSGDRFRLSDELELVRLGGHFAGGTVCTWGAGAGGSGALLAGDIVQVVADPDWVSFMWSYPNLIPLPPREVERIRAAIEPLRFDRLYGAWWDRVIDCDAHRKVLRSADRYLDRIS